MDESRYSRQLHCVPGFRQSALSRATILIVGMGGLGCNASLALAAAGIGTLAFCDHDTVSLSNLNRQILYREADIGRKKVRLAEERLRELNPDPDYIALDGRFHENILPASLQPLLILDCLDNLASRIELIGYASKNNISLVHGAVDGFMGQLSLYMPGKSGCPLCGMAGGMAPDERETSTPSLAACVSIIAGLQAAEAIKYLTGSGELCVGRLKFFDGLSGMIDTVYLERDATCIACSRQRERDL